MRGPPTYTAGSKRFMVVAPFSLRPRVCWSILQMMVAVHEAGLVPDIDMLAAAMDACSKARDNEGAMHFMDQAVRLGLEPDDGMFREVRSVV